MVCEISKDPIHFLFLTLVIRYFFSLQILLHAMLRFWQKVTEQRPLSDKVDIVRIFKKILAQSIFLISQQSLAGNVTINKKVMYMVNYFLKFGTVFINEQEEKEE